MKMSRGPITTTGRARASLLVVMLMLLAAACGGGGDTTADPTATDGLTGTGTETAADDGETFELRFGDANPPSDTSPMTLVTNFFIDELESRSDGRIQVEYFPNSELGTNPELLSGVQSGSIDFASITSGVVASEDERYLVYSLPFLVPDHDALYNLFDADVSQELLQGLEDEGAIGLYLMDQGPFMPLTKDEPVPSPDDWQGLKMRVIQDPLTVAMIEELGAQAVPLDFPEVYPSLQQGVIEGVLASPSAFMAVSLNEVATEVTMLPTNWVIQPVFVAQATMDRLPDDLQQVVRDAAAAAAEHAEQQTRDLLEQAASALEEAGFTVTTDVDFAPFEERMAPVYEEFEGRIGADVVEAARSAVAGG